MSLKVCTEYEADNLILRYNLQFFAEGDGADKTEPATQKKLKDAREEGKVAKSKELTAAFDLIVLFLVLKIFVSFVGNRLILSFRQVYTQIPSFLEINRESVSSVAVHGMFLQMILDYLIACLPFFLFGVAITFLISVIQVGWQISTKPMEPKLDKFNPINGFKRILSKESLFNLVLSIAKISLLTYVAYTTINGDADKLFILYELELNQAIALIGNIIINTGLKISIIYLLVGIIDWAYQKHKFNEDMKMTKQEVKDEFKNTEGDPQIKGQQRRRMQEASQRRMMQDVPKADVVITNPTHFAVAIRYDAESHTAPVVLAKGEDFIAQKIKEVAKEHHVPIVENKPLARTLYANVEIGEEIPPELYQAVAEVLAMIYSQ